MQRGAVLCRLRPRPSFAQIDGVGNGDRGGQFRAVSFARALLCVAVLMALFDLWRVGWCEIVNNLIVASIHDEYDFGVS